MPVPNADDLALLCDAALAAGTTALGYWKRNPTVWDKADGQGPVSAADLAVDEQLHTILTKARPDYGWVSEESAPEAAPSAAPSFVVDPIDGTRAFLDGQRTWSVALAIVTEGQPVCAVVHTPALDRLYAARSGGGATRDGRSIAVTGRRDVDGAQVLATRATLEADRWQGGPPGVERHFRPSLAYRLALVAEGRFDGMMTLRDSWIWDIAAGALLVREAGGAVFDRHGASLRFDAPSRQVAGALAGDASFAAKLIGQLARPDAA